MTDLLHGELVYYLQGVGFRIHRELKGGHLEADYEQALAWVLEEDDVTFRRQPVYNIKYKGKQVGLYRPDLIVGDDDVLLELKSAAQIEAVHMAQTLSYLRLTDIDLGLIMNFGSSSMQYKRLPNFTSQRRNSSSQAPAPPTGILYPELTNHLLRVLFEVRTWLGSGFLHRVYRRATRVELGLQGLSHDYITELPLKFEGRELGTRQVRLLLVESKILVATLALQSILPKFSEKLRWAMQELNIPLGLLANFHPSEFEVRFIRK